MRLIPEGDLLLLQVRTVQQKKKSVYMQSTQNINDVLMVSLTLFKSLGEQSG